MEKKFDHAVIYDGVFYPANTPIKVKEAPKKTAQKGGAKDDSTAD